MLSRDRQRVLGTGFFVTERLVVTCWHVLDTLSDTERNTICLEVLQSHEKATARLRVEASSPPEVADFALLELTAALRGPCTPLPLGASAQSADHRFATFGFPRGFDDTGTWARGTIGYATGDGDFRKLLLHGSDIREGFSGSPLFDEQTRRVVGVVRFKAVSSEAREAYATPTEHLLARCPELRASEDCPYRDLASFRESDARFWKGRGRVLDNHLLPQLAKLPRFVEVSGPSGSGKSSLLHAGLIPALRNGTSIPGSQHWDVRALRPGLEPFAALDGIRLPAGEDLVARVQAWRAENPEPGKRLVLVIDQLEDVLLRGGGVELTRHQRFLEQLSSLADVSLPVTCVVALREGFDAVLSERAPKLRSLLGEHRVQVPSVLTPMELREIIAGPAREVGLRFDPPEVVDSIAMAAQEEFRVEAGAGARVTVLPLLEVTLTQLWQSARDGAITLEAFNASAGLLGSLARWADGVHESLKPVERRVADRLLLELVQLGEAENGQDDKGRRVPLEVLRERLGEQADVDAVLQVLVNGRLLVTAQDGHQQRETVELIHDALLTHWHHFVKLRTENRAFRRWHEAVQADAERWREAERAQQAPEAEARLLRGEALTRAHQMLTAHAQHVSEWVQRYVLRSQEVDQRQRNQARRNRWLAIGASVSALLTLWVLYARTVDSKQQAVAADAAAAQKASELFWRVRISEANAVVSLSREPGREVEALARAIQLAGTALPKADAAQEEVTEALTESIAAFLYSAPLSTEPEARTVSAFSPDSRHLFTRGILVLPVMRLVSRLWDVRTGSLLHEFESHELCPESSQTDCMSRLYTDVSAEDTHAFGFSPDQGDLWVGGFQGALLKWSPDRPVTSIPDAHSARVTAVAFSEKGDRVLSTSLDGTAKLWDARTGQRLKTLPHSEPCTQGTLSADARYAWVGGAQKTCLFDLTSNAARPRRCFKTKDPGPTLAFSPSGKLAALGDRQGDGTLILVDVPSGSIHLTLTDLDGHALMPSFEDDCSLSAFNDIFSSALTVRFCDRGPGIAPGNTSAAKKRTTWQPITLQGRLFADGRRGVARPQDPVNENPFTRVPQSSARWMVRNSPMDLQPDRALLAPDGRTLLVHDTPGLTRKTIDITTWTRNVPGGLAVSPDLRWLVAKAPQDEHLTLIHLASSRRIRMASCDGEYFDRMADAEFSSDGQTLAVRCGTQIQFWDVSPTNAALRQQPPPIEAGFSRFALPGNWRWRHASPSDTGPKEGFRMETSALAHLQRAGGTGAEPCQTQRAFPPGAHVKFAPNGKYFSIKAGGDVHLGTTRDCQLVHDGPLATSTFFLQGEPFSPDGERFVTASTTAESAALWESSTGERVKLLPTTLSTAYIAFSSDSRYLSVANQADVFGMRQASLFDAVTGSRLHLGDIDGQLRSLFFSPDASLIVAVTDDGIHLFESKTRKRLSKIDTVTGSPLHLDDNHGRIIALSFSPDTSRLVAVTDDGIHLFDAQTGERLRKINWRSAFHVSVHHTRERFGVSGGAGRLDFWSTHDGQHVGALHGAVGAAKMDAEGMRAVTFDEDGAYFFSLRPEDLLRQACALLRGRGEATQVQSICNRFNTPAAPLAGPLTP
ncbi:trypsin-like peptidase domain-containing protein [Myxococcus sp. 1LA]